MQNDHAARSVASFNRMSEKWTLTELMAEWQYRYDERLGILCGSGEPTVAEEQMAEKDAHNAIAALLAASRERVRQWQPPLGSGHAAHACPKPPEIT